MQINYDFVNKGFKEWIAKSGIKNESSSATDHLNQAYHDGFADAYYTLFSLINDASISQQDIDMALDIYIADKALNRSARGAMLRTLRFIFETRRLQLKMEMENA